MYRLVGHCHRLKIHVIAADQVLPANKEGYRIEVPARHAETIDFLMSFVTMRVLNNKTKPVTMATLEIAAHLLLPVPDMVIDPIGVIADQLIRYCRHEKGGAKRLTLNLIVPAEKMEELELALEAAQSRNPS